MEKSPHYVSPIDRYLAEFDRTHPLSQAQQYEKKKYEIIYKKRDHAQAAPKQDMVLEFLESD